MKTGRGFLLCEFALFFALLPPLIAAFKPRGWMYLLLWVASLLAYYWLMRNGDNFRSLWNWRALDKKLTSSILLRAVPLSLALLLFTYIAIPDHLFGLPQERPWVWLLVMFFYPVLSVVPQEIIFRSFIFRRYAALFPSPNLMIAFSALAFGWVHILLLNSVAVIFSALGGVLFSSTYKKTGSLAAVCFEHALYGCLIFTFGLGYYFYHGQSVH